MCCSEFHAKQAQDSLELVNTSFGDDGWCTCHGKDDDGNPIGYCCGYATQADGKCDRCREHCESHPHHDQPAEQADHLPLVGQPLLAQAYAETFPDERRVEVASVS